MSKLSGWIYIVVGTAVIAYSKYIESKTASSLGFFTLLGFGFLLYGLYLEYITRTKKVPSPQKHPHRHKPLTQPAQGQRQHSPHKTHQHVQQKPRPHHPHTPPYKTCPTCHRKNPLHQQHCTHCRHTFY
jgi:hypothetical protein